MICPLCVHLLSTTCSRLSLSICPQTKQNTITQHNFGTASPGLLIVRECSAQESIYVRSLGSFSGPKPLRLQTIIQIRNFACVACPGSCSMFHTTLTRKRRSHPLPPLFKRPEHSYKVLASQSPSESYLELIPFSRLQLKGLAQKVYNKHIVESRL